MSKEKIIGTKQNCLFQCFYCEKNRREKKVRKTEDYLTERDWEVFSSCLWQIYISEWKGEVVDKVYWGEEEKMEG